VYGLGSYQELFYDRRFPLRNNKQFLLCGEKTRTAPPSQQHRAKRYSNLGAKKMYHSPLRRNLLTSIAVLSCVLACVVLQSQWSTSVYYELEEQGQDAAATQEEQEAALQHEQEASADQEQQEGAPPLNIYQRIDGGYAYRLRPPSPPKPAERKVYAEPPPILLPGSVFPNKYAPPPVQRLEIPTRWSGELREQVDPITLEAAHRVTPAKPTVTENEAPAEEEPAAEDEPVAEEEGAPEEKARTTLLAEEGELPAEEEETEEGGKEKEDMSFLDTPWMDDWLKYSKDILTPYEQKELEEVGCRPQGKNHDCSKHVYESVMTRSILLRENIVFVMIVDIGFNVRA
jgi:hypothetical protein